MQTTTILNPTAKQVAEALAADRERQQNAREAEVERLMVMRKARAKAAAPAMLAQSPGE